MRTGMFEILWKVIEKKTHCTVQQMSAIENKELKGGKDIKVFCAEGLGVEINSNSDRL